MYNNIARLSMQHSLSEHAALLPCAYRTACLSMQHCLPLHATCHRRCDPYKNGRSTTCCSPVMMLTLPTSRRIKGKPSFLPALG